MDEKNSSPEFMHYVQLCEDLGIGSKSTVIANTGQGGDIYSRLLHGGKIPPLEQVGPKNKVSDEDLSHFKSIVQQTGIPLRVLEPAIKFGITAYMLQQIDELGLDEVEHGCFLSGLRICKKEWARWKEGTEPVPPERLNHIATYFSVPVDVFTSYTSLKKSIRDDIFHKYLKERKIASLKSTIELALEIDEEAIIINHGGVIQILSGNSEEMEKAVKKIYKIGLRDFAEYIETVEYKAEKEKRINLRKTKPY